MHLERSGLPTRVYLDSEKDRQLGRKSLESLGLEVPADSDSWLLPLGTPLTLHVSSLVFDGLYRLAALQAKQTGTEMPEFGLSATDEHLQKLAELADAYEEPETKAA